MTTQHQQGDRAQPGEVSSWALGGIAFASTMLIMVGSFQAVSGLTAALNADFYAPVANYAFDLDVTAWGWLHLVLGVIAVVVGIGLIGRATWAGVAGIIIAMLSALANFLFIPYAPMWAIVIIAIDMWIIWSLTRPGAIRT